MNPPGEPRASPPARLDAVVRGRVQGVGFRYFIVRRAAELGLHGWVANHPDGSVSCRAEGDRRSLAALLGDLRTGPPSARVDGVEASWSPASGTLPPFTVRSGSHPGD